MHTYKKVIIIVASAASYVRQFKEKASRHYLTLTNILAGFWINDTWKYYKKCAEFQSLSSPNVAQYESGKAWEPTNN